MKYRVLLTDRAANQLDAAYHWYQDHAAHAVTRWYRGLRDAIRGLSEQPDRFPLARESETFPYPLREMPYGVGRRKTHRVLFVVRPSSVVIYAIRHVAQRDVDPLE